ncbi:MAG TPA: sulfurtransferase [Gemmataceae bacterium]|nr:sulfurtransferase [Gemmataceae bacterium]
MSPILMGFVLAVTPGDYANPDMLVEPSNLLTLTDATKRPVRILDARPHAQYLAGHIPGTVWVDVPDWAKAFAAGQNEAEWTRRIAALDIGPGDTVVVYDDNLSKDAARIWYILRYWGCDDVRLLNGGWKAWQASGGKPESGPPIIGKIELELKPQPDRLATKDQMLDLLKGKSPQIVDARSNGEFCGTENTAQRNGSIPGAVHLEWSDALDKDTGKFRSADQLTKLFQKAGIDPSQPAVTYCQSGGRAAVMAFVLELMGDKNVRSYYRGWSEWGNDADAPIVKPKADK